jgi:hypothetical protein
MLGTNIVVHKINGIPAPSAYNQRASTTSPRAFGGYLLLSKRLLVESSISTYCSCAVHDIGTKPTHYVEFEALTAVVMKSPLTSSRPHGVISQNTELFKPTCCVGLGILRAMVIRSSIFQCSCFQPVHRGTLERHEWQSWAPRICSYFAVKKTVMANLIFGVG